MTNPSPTSRSQALLDRVDAWANAGPVRAVAVKVGVTIVGPLLVVAGIAMLVLPGPGLVVIGLGLALLAAEYAWARHVLGLLGRTLSWLRRLAFPTGGSPARKVTGALATGAVLVSTTALTGAVTALVGSQAFL
ncbi:PGPGW domain-containing protein [Nocardioides caricicola]|uniref:PGPGW domain-containing protein n=1 Tax=Nocardioides caricicola TaxID=634770 RepID=A0ABW0MU65_9ACTN